MSKSASTKPPAPVGEPKAQPSKLVAIDDEVKALLDGLRRTKVIEMKRVVSAATMFYLSCPRALREMLMEMYLDWIVGGRPVSGLPINRQEQMPIAVLWQTYANPDSHEAMARAIRELGGVDKGRFQAILSRLSEAGGNDAASASSPAEKQRASRGRKRRE